MNADLMMNEKKGPREISRDKSVKDQTVCLFWRDRERDPGEISQGPKEVCLFQRDQEVAHR